MGKKNAEFVAAQSSRDNPLGFAQESGQGDQYFVARRVSEGVIYVLEAIDVADRKAEGPAGGMGYGDVLVKLRAQTPAIHQTRQRVVLRVEDQLFLGLLSLRDVGMCAHHPRRVSCGVPDRFAARQNPHVM